MTVVGLACAGPAQAGPSLAGHESVPASSLVASPHPPDPADGLVGVRLVDAPVALASDPRAHMYVIDHLAPGTVIHRRIEVSNRTDGNRDMELYTAAASVTDGHFVFGDDRAANELSGWATITPALLHLKPHTRAVVVLTVQVPPRASAGERYAVAWAENRSPTAGGANVGQVGRVGIRMYLDIGPGGDPPSDFVIVGFTPGRSPTGAPTITAQVHNTGQRALDLTGAIDLTDGPAGLRAGPYPVDTGTTLAAGQTGSVEADLDSRLPLGPWKVVLSLSSGTVQREAGATITLTSPGTTGRLVAADAGRPANRWLLVAAATLVPVTLSALAVRLRRRASTNRLQAARSSTR